MLSLSRSSQLPAPKPGQAWDSFLGTEDINIRNFHCSLSRTQPKHKRLVHSCSFCSSKEGSVRSGFTVVTSFFQSTPLLSVWWFTLKVDLIIPRLSVLSSPETPALGSPETGIQSLREAKSIALIKTLVTSDESDDWEKGSFAWTSLLCVLMRKNYDVKKISKRSKQGCAFKDMRCTPCLLSSLLPRPASTLFAYAFVFLCPSSGLYVDSSAFVSVFAVLVCVG